MPGFFSPKPSSTVTMRPACCAPEGSRSTIWLISVNTLDSMNSIRPSNIWALLAKWRYSAASLTDRRAASAAVVMRSAPGCSSICARVCRICTRRSPGLGRLRTFSAFGATASASDASGPAGARGSLDSSGRSDITAGFSLSVPSAK